MPRINNSANAVRINPGGGLQGKLPPKLMNSPPLPPPSLGHNSKLLASPFLLVLYINRSVNTKSQGSSILIELHSYTGHMVEVEWEGK